jgi:hypothetical protein
VLIDGTKLNRRLPVIAQLCASEINASVETFFDCGWRVAIGDRVNGWLATGTVDSWPEAEAWLDANARKLYPESNYALLNAPMTAARISTAPANISA